MKKIFISTSSFAEFDTKPLEMLRRADLDIAINPYRRKLSAEELLKLAVSAEGLIAGTESLNAEVLKSLKQLKVISRCGSGLDNVDIEAASGLGIKVFNTPVAVTLAVAELTVGLILSLLRQTCLMDRELRAGKWKKRMGFLLFGKTVGVVGLGRVGSKVAELLKALGATVIYYDPYTSQKNRKAFKYTELEYLLRESDIVTLHLSYNKEDYHLFGDREFFKMKKGAYFLNSSRGGIVDEVALYAALKDGRLAGAAIDVFENEPYNGPLKELDNVILTPHIGSYAKEARIKMEIQAVQNLLNGLEETQGRR